MLHALSECTSELATTQLVTLDASSHLLPFHPWISFCASFQSSTSASIYPDTLLPAEDIAGVGIDRRVIDRTWYIDDEDDDDDLVVVDATVKDDESF